MEHQIQMLESRLNRRDSEMKSAVEEVKLSAKMERSRLQAIHDQEMREKDEQLVRFQSELEQLVQAMKIWQHGIVPVSSMSV